MILGLDFATFRLQQALVREIGPRKSSGNGRRDGGNCRANAGNWRTALTDPFSEPLDVCPMMLG